MMTRNEVVGLLHRAVDATFIEFAEEILRVFDENIALQLAKDTIKKQALEIAALRGFTGRDAS